MTLCLLLWELINGTSHQNIGCVSSIFSTEGTRHQIFTFARSERVATIELFLQLGLLCSHSVNAAIHVFVDLEPKLVTKTQVKSELFFR